LRRYLMLYTRWGDETHVYIMASTNGLAWAPVQTLLTLPAGEHVAYPFIIGTTSEQSDSDAWLVYQRSPATQPGRYRDIIQLPIHFTAPNDELHDPIRRIERGKTEKKCSAQLKDQEKS
jgi:hypothetical protein